MKTNVNALIAKISGDRLTALERQGDKYTAQWYEVLETLQLTKMDEVEDCSHEDETGDSQGYVAESDL